MEQNDFFSKNTGEESNELLKEKQKLEKKKRKEIRRQKLKDKDYKGKIIKILKFICKYILTNIALYPLILSFVSWMLLSSTIDNAKFLLASIRNMYIAVKVFFFISLAFFFAHYIKKIYVLSSIGLIITSILSILNINNKNEINELNNFNYITSEQMVLSFNKLYGTLNLEKVKKISEIVITEKEIIELEKYFDSEIKELDFSPDNNWGNPKNPKQLEKLVVPWMGKNKEDNHQEYSMIGAIDNHILSFFGFYTYYYDSQSPKHKENYITNGIVLGKYDKWLYRWYDTYAHYFYLPPNLKTIVLTNETTITENSFYNVNTMEKLGLCKEIEYIGKYAFSGCTNLKDVYYEGTKEEWEKVQIMEDENDVLLNATMHFNFDIESL